MTDYMTEQEQIEALKRSIKQYAPVVIAGFIIAMIAMSGYRYYLQKQNEKFARASNTYDIMLTKRVQLDASGVDLSADKLLNKFNKTVYANMAAFMKARALIDKKDYRAASKQLEWVISHADSKAFSQIAKLRLARIQLEENKPTLALNTLKKVDDDTFTGLINEIKGDAYVAMKDNALAKKAYKQALNDIPNAEVIRPLLQMKYDNIAQESA